MDSFLILVGIFKNSFFLEVCFLWLSFRNGPAVDNLKVSGTNQMVYEGINSSKSEEKKNPTLIKSLRCFASLFLLYLISNEKSSNKETEKEEDEGEKKRTNNSHS